MECDVVQYLHRNCFTPALCKGGCLNPPSVYDTTTTVKDDRHWCRYLTAPALTENVACEQMRLFYVVHLYPEIEMGRSIRCACARFSSDHATTYIGDDHTTPGTYHSSTSFHHVRRLVVSEFVLNSMCNQSLWLEIWSRVRRPYQRSSWALYATNPCGSGSCVIVFEGSLYLSSS